MLLVDFYSTTKLRYTKCTLRNFLLVLRDLSQLGLFWNSIRWNSLRRTPTIEETDETSRSVAPYSTKRALESIPFKPSRREEGERLLLSYKTLHVTVETTFLELYKKYSVFFQLRANKEALTCLGNKIGIPKRVGDEGVEIAKRRLVTVQW